MSMSRGMGGCRGEKELPQYRVVLVPGDGVGPEIMVFAEKLLSSIEGIELIRIEAGLAYYERTGQPYPSDFEELVLSADAVIKGPLATPSRGGYRSITLRLRRLLGIYADVRRFETRTSSLVVVRESSEGIYSGVEGVFGDAAVALKVVTRRAAQRIARTGFEQAKRLGYSRVIAAHKATVLRATDGLFLEEFYNVAKNYPGIEALDLLVDSTAYHIVKNPSGLGVVVTLNQYGDILSDVAAAVAGSIGLFASAQFGEKGALFEPIHGTGMDIAGKGIANPVSALRATQYLLEYLGREHSNQELLAIAEALSKSIDEVIWEKRVVTPDLGGDYSTREVGEAILSELATQVPELKP